MKQQSSVLWECGKVEDFSIFPQNKGLDNMVEDYSLLCNYNPMKGGQIYLQKRGQIC